MKRIVIFGPPASGKSTLVKELNQKGYASIDVEDLGGTYEERTENFLKEVESEKSGVTFYGGADLKLEDLPSKTFTVLVCPSDINVYKERISNRNKNNPEKCEQNEIEVYEWFYSNREAFDHWIDNLGTPEETIVKILGVIEK